MNLIVFNLEKYGLRTAGESYYINVAVDILGAGIIVWVDAPPPDFIYAPLISKRIS